METMNKMKRQPIALAGLKNAGMIYVREIFFTNFCCARPLLLHAGFL